ncbi:MAG TPA: peptide ABC transporter substrate-binding protein [Ktedonobacteraceae bacterium]
MLKKPRPRFLIMSFSIVAVLMLLLSACGGTSTTPSTTPSAGGTPVKGGTWIDDLFEEPDSLIPNASNETFAAMLMYALYEPPVYGTPEGKLMPGVATEVPTVANGDVSADLKTVTYHLRPGLVWSDGQPLDARDFDFTWKLWGNPKFPAINTTNNSDIASADVSSDNLSITFHLKAPLVSFVANWVDGYYGLLPAHVYSSMDPASITKSANNLNPSVVNGPFMMSEVKPGDHYTIVPNPKYRLASQGLPYLDKVVFRIVPDQNTILKDLQAGTADSAWFLDVSKALAYQSLSAYKVVGDPKTYSFEALYFNLKNKVLANNPEIRQAIAMTTDQQTLIQVARRGVAGPLCTDHTVTQNPGYTQGITCPQMNPPDFKGANALLDSKGWVAGSDGVRAKNGQRLEFQYSTTAGNLWRSDDQLINQTNWKKIGIKVDIQNYPASTLFGSFVLNAKPGVYDIGEWATSNTYDPDDAGLLQCGNPSNLSYYCSTQMDALIKQEQSSGVPSVRQQAFDAIHKLELTDFPFVIEFAAPDVAIYKLGVHNYQPSLLGLGSTENIWLWWCDNGKCPA